MREILFRGKTKNGQWVYGCYYKQKQFYGEKVESDCIIVTDDILSNDLGLDYEEVIPETIGQFTGLTDKNDTKIFEGDIVNVVYTEKRNYQGVKYDDEFEMIETVIYYEKHACFMLEINDGEIPLVRPLHDFKSKIKIKEIEVIGNKWDNP